MQMGKRNPSKLELKADTIGARLRRRQHPYGIGTRKVAPAKNAATKCG